MAFSTRGLGDVRAAGRVHAHGVGADRTGGGDGEGLRGGAGDASRGLVETLAALVVMVAPTSAFWLCTTAPVLSVICQPTARRC